jgi:hypothetical protein
MVPDFVIQKPRVLQVLTRIKLVRAEIMKPVTLLHKPTIVDIICIMV